MKQEICTYAKTAIAVMMLMSVFLILTNQGLCGELDIPLDDNNEITLPVGRTYTWAPKKDIQPYEIALIIPMLMCFSNMITSDLFCLDDRYNNLPPEAQRHWRVDSTVDNIEQPHKSDWEYGVVY